MHRIRIETNGGKIVDGKTGDLPGDLAGVMAYTAEHRNYIGAGFQLRDDSGSINMAVDASLGGTPENVYIDEPTANWTNTALSGTWDFASTTQVQGGTTSIDATATLNGDEAQLERSSSISLGSYAAISGYVYLDSYNANQHDIFIEVRLAGSIVGNAVSLNDYVNTGIIGSWQQFVIPKIEMGLDGSTIDQVVIRTATTSGNAPDYYIDTINIEETGSAIFTYAPLPGQVFEIVSVALSFLDGSPASVEPDQFLGAGKLSNGVIIRTRVGGITRFGTAARSFYDLLSAGAQVESIIEGATDTSVNIISPSPALTRLRGDDRDTYSFVLSDDLSALTSFTAVIRGRILL